MITKPKFWVIIIIILLIIVFSGTSLEGYLGKLRFGRDSLPDQHELQRIKELVKNAVEDEDWMKAETREEIEEMLGRYYSGMLLQELIDNAWDFVSSHTDWYGQAKLENFEVISYDNNKLVACVKISETDITTGETIYGEAVYTIVKTGQGWRISSAGYNWNLKD